jgi:hypothetical protein
MEQLHGQESHGYLIVKNPRDVNGYLRRTRKTVKIHLHFIVGSSIFDGNRSDITRITWKRMNMRARWINHTPSPGLPVVGRTIIATYWPGQYFIVSTTEVESDTPLRKFQRSVALKVDFENVPNEPDIFMTRIFKCDKQGSHKAAEKPLYEREYPTYLEAMNGHNETVDLFVQDQLQLE